MFLSVKAPHRVFICDLHGRARDIQIVGREVYMNKSKVLRPFISFWRRYLGPTPDRLAIFIFEYDALFI